MKNISLIIALFLCWNTFAKEADPLPVKQGKNGVYILLSDKGFSEKDQLYGRFTSVVVQRAVGDERFKEIGKLARASSADEFEKLIAKDALLSIAQLKKLNSKKEAWEYVQSHDRLNDYGILAMEMNLGVALGAYYLDKEAAVYAPGTPIKYKILISDGKETKELNTSITLSGSANVQKPVMLAKSESDSVISIQWTVLKSKSPDVMFANVYAKEGDPSEFKFLQRVFANIDQRSDTIRFYLTHFVQPGIQFRYFIRPATMALQEGPASDTVIATSVNFTTLQEPLQLKAKDTTNGIFLSWKLDQKTNARKSIIIERSSNIEKPFLTLATLPATAMSYMDATVQPSFTYYYRVRIATIENTVLPPSAHISARHVLKSFSPMAPQNVKAKVQKKGVLISWSKVISPDIAGYYVARNNGMDTIYENVSLLVKDTSFTDTADLYGRNTYTWAVRTFTYADMSSAWAYSSSMQVGNDIKPQAPSGNRAYTQPGLVHLSWDDTKHADAYIKGYNVYRKEGNLKKEKLTTSGLKEAGFVKLTTVSGNEYIDKISDEGNYQYAVTSVDLFGKESEVGFVQPVETKAPYVAVPEQFSVRKTSKGMTISWDIVKQEGVKTYTIYKRSASETTAVKLTSVDIAKGQYVDVNVKAGTVYYYSLSASGDYGTSAISGERFAKY